MTVQEPKGLKGPKTTKEAKETKGQADAALPERARLHITPLNETLLKTYIPPSLLPSATDISYHSLQTFPERNYGYVELPTADAQRIKKKLNGTILRGSKVRIEEAVPKRFDPTDSGLGHEQDIKETKESTESNEKDALTEGKLVSSSKKRKREDGVLPGYELPNNRSVKRGWTEPPSYKRDKKMAKKEDKDQHKKRAPKSAYSAKPECLFRTTLPPNVASSVVKSGGAGSTLESPKKKKGEKLGGKSGRDTVVHEFANTKKELSFLKQSDGAQGKKGPLRFVEGQGWVDDEGNVVEGLGKRAKRDVPVGAKGVGKMPEGRFMRDSSDEESESESESEGEKGAAKVEDETSSSGSSASEDSDSDSESSSEAESDSESEDESESEADEQIKDGKANGTVKSNLGKATKKSQPSIKKSSPPSESASDSESDNDSEPESESGSESASNQDDKDESSSEASSTSESEPESESKSNKPASFLTPTSALTTDADAMDIDSTHPPAAPSATSPGEKEIHPLEALFKRPAPASTAPTTSSSLAPQPTATATQIEESEATPGFGFSFFGPDEDVDDDYVAQGNAEVAEEYDNDYDDYGGWGGHEEYNEGDEAAPRQGSGRPAAGAGKEGTGAGGADGGEESAFAKWFWEHRGDTNRGWKRRRREVAKEQRQRENRRFGKKLFG